MLRRSVRSDSLRPHGLLPTRLLCPWGFSWQEYWSGLPCPLPGDLPNPGIKSRSPALQVDSLPSETPGKPKNTGVDTLFHLQGISLTQEPNQGLLDPINFTLCFNFYFSSFLFCFHLFCPKLYIDKLANILWSYIIQEMRNSQNPSTRDFP